MNEQLKDFGVCNLNLEIIEIFDDSKDVVQGYWIVENAEYNNACEEEWLGQYLLAHQEEIPESLRGQVEFVFVNWRDPVDAPYQDQAMAVVCWCPEEQKWLVEWGDIWDSWVRHEDEPWKIRFLRLKQEE